MARLIKPLTAAQVGNAKPKASMYKMFDGGGLFLQVNPSGGKHWKMKYRKNDGKEGLLTFGPYPAVTLEQARKLRDEARARKAAGVDPGLARREEKAQRTKLARNTFEAVARTWMDVHGTKVKPQTMHIYKVVLEKCVFPIIGWMPIKNLEAPDFLDLLRRLEAQGQLYTVKRVAIVCGLIMRFAVATGQASIDPLPSLRGSLKAHKTKHLAATIDPKEVGRLLRSIEAYPGSFAVSCALKIANLTAAQRTMKKETLEMVVNDDRVTSHGLMILERWAQREPAALWGLEGDSEKFMAVLIEHQEWASPFSYDSFDQQLRNGLTAHEIREMGAKDLSCANAIRRQGALFK